MSFDINTNTASLQAQNYLNANTEFQNQTIQEVTSGYRIVNSGDDAAGLAIANADRSNEAVLTQGIQNANDGLNQLQIADGGINNISQLLDRATTLATQSASGTFTGDRTVLNNEFQSVVAEIDRQAQAIGLNTGGQFARSLSVYIGGGEASNGTTAIQNGSVNLNLTDATVDAKSLGLNTVQTNGVAGTDIGTGSNTSVKNILDQVANTATEVKQGYTTFEFSGPGFGGTSGIAVSVNLTGVTDANGLVTAINAGIQAAGTGTSQTATAFRNADITASLNVDANNMTQLSFSSSSGAFQVQAGDQVANAFLGNLSTTSIGQGLAIPTQTTTATGAADTGNPLAQDVSVYIQGAGMASPVQLSLSAATDDTAGAALTDLQNQVSTNTTLQAAGINESINGAGNLVFSSTQGQPFTVYTVGDLGNQLGFGTAATSAAATPTYSVAGAIPTGDNPFFDAGGSTSSGSLAFNALAAGDTQSLAINGIDTGGAAHPTVISLTAANAGTIDQAIDSINSQLQGTNDPTLKQITAVKEWNGTSYGINFISTLNSFSIGVDQTMNAGAAVNTDGIGSAATGTGVQGTVVNSSIEGTGGTVNITNQGAAEAAVTALTAAVTILGQSQAVVGRGENEFTYAVNLAQSQLTNTQTAEAGIRDADLAAEAANLTKAQILVQAGVAALAQANSAPQQVLSLLRGT